MTIETAMNQAYDELRKLSIEQLRRAKDEIWRFDNPEQMRVFCAQVDYTILKKQRGDW